MAKSGDVCPKCRRGQFCVYCTRPAGDYQQRFLRCNNCGETDKEVALRESIRPRLRFDGTTAIGTQGEQ